jgi:hypothetical protein
MRPDMIIDKCNNNTRSNKTCASDVDIYNYLSESSIRVN